MTFLNERLTNDIPKRGIYTDYPQKKDPRPICAIGWGGVLCDFTQYVTTVQRVSETASTVNYRLAENGLRQYVINKLNIMQRK